MKRPIVLVINCGSSSLKFALHCQGELEPLASGLAESLSRQDARLKISLKGGAEPTTISLPLSDHGEAIQRVVTFLHDKFDLEANLVGVGHRVVHGGDKFSQASLITEEALDEIKHCIPLAPLHNPANIMGIELAQEAFKGVPQVAVFDTAFHQTMPAKAYRYALPNDLYSKLAVRRYGFHGTSHQYVSMQAAAYLEKTIDECCFVSAHLGNGASVCAIENGKSVDTSMGMTPLEGLVMGTRSGDIDPGIFAYLLRNGYSGDEIDDLLNKKSGLFGLSGISNDMRTLQQAAEDGSKDAALAIDVFCFRLAKYISAMTVSLSKIDALIFTGGIGENSTYIRTKTCEQLSNLNFYIDESLNTRDDASVKPIQAANSHKILVVKTNEEWMIADQTFQHCVGS